MSIEKLTDKELYRKYLDGDQKSFEELVLRYKNQIIFFISRYTKNTAVAEDISQDVFVYLLLNKEQYNFQYSFKTYIFMIAKCRAINYIKKEKKIVNINELDNLAICDKELEEVIYKKEKERKIKIAMNQLKADYQVVIYLTTFEGMKYKEVAKIMNKNIGQIKSMLNRARKKLKKILEEEEIYYEK